MSEQQEAEFGKLPLNWVVSIIEEETDFVTDYVANGSFASLAENVNYKSDPDYAILIRLTDYNNGFSGSFVYVDQHAYEFLRKSKLYGGEIVISNVGAYSGTVFLAPKLKTPMTLGPNAIMMNFKNGNLFYYYWLKSPMGQYLLDGIISGSAQPKFNKTSFRKLPIPVPPLPEQKAIASVLSSLDDKIDLLHRQNKTLEAMAETLFRQWFVEEADESWESVKLGDYVETNISSLKKKSKLSEIQYLDTSSLTEGKISELQLLPIEEAPSRAKRIVKHNDVLISTVRPNQKHYGIIRNPEENLIVSTGFTVITCSNIDPFFVYIFLTTEEMTEYLHSIAEGSTSTYPSLKPSDIEDLDFQLPPEDKMKAFTDLCHETWNKIEYNHKQIFNLEKLHNILLPKLMTGEVVICE